MYKLKKDSVLSRTEILYLLRTFNKKQKVLMSDEDDDEQDLADHTFAVDDETFSIHTKLLSGYIMLEDEDMEDSRGTDERISNDKHKALG